MIRPHVHRVAPKAYDEMKKPIAENPLVLLKNESGRKMKMQRMWAMPAAIVSTGYSFALNHTPPLRKRTGKASMQRKMKNTSTIVPIDLSFSKKNSFLPFFRR